MLTKLYKKKCILFEGLDNSGKTTMIKKLLSDFPNKFVNVSEPCHDNDCLLGNFLRKTILNNRNLHLLSNNSKTLLFTADRFEHLSKYNLEIQNDKIFLFDRSFLSLFAYSQSSDIFLDNIMKINKIEFEKIFDIIAVF